LSGVAEFETADGSTRRLFPGDVLVAEDLTGHGHIARSIGEEFRVSLAIPLAEDFLPFVNPDLSHFLPHLHDRLTTHPACLIARTMT
jgi:hypothetical protein